MTYRSFAFALALLLVVFGAFLMSSPQAGTRKVSIAHRGASAYAPEHTLAAYRLAVEQGADYIEQDLALTRDGVLICLHDDTLERTTNVEEVFPERAVTDAASGRRRWFAVDFTLAEIKTLDAGSWFDPRFAGERVPTWSEAVTALGPEASLYPELKTPTLYRERGLSMARAFADSVRTLGLSSRRRGALIVQSFDEGTLRELATLLPDVPRTLLIETADGTRWLTPESLREVARFATGIGPSKGLLDGKADLVRAARNAGLSVTPYTFTTMGPPSRFKDVREEMAYYLFDLGVDGLFTDNPDRFPR
jgi:glycerophosphoryl diester phosphodiesterase